MTYDLEVEIKGGKATARLSSDREKNADMGTVDIDSDPLRLETVRFLQQWLGRWRLVSQIGSDDRYRDFPVLETFRVLGEQLYQIVFRGGVGNAFNQAYTDATEAGQPLRVILSFGEDSTELAALPWEFLYRRADSGPSFYLATETHLLLNRCLPTGRTTMPVAVLPLRVLFVVCLPEAYGSEEEEQKKLRDGILGSIRRLKEKSASQLDVEMIPYWDVDKVEVELKKHPHVVHIVGHARQERDSSGRITGKILLPGPGGGLQWSDAQTLAQLLTRGKSSSQLPRLVILHLCETKPINFTASFERLAPELIKVGIPAVLAMQYPLSADAARKFTSKFYERLVAGHEIDLIVQESRYEMYSRLQDDRLIGTPVLYMQSLGGQLVDRQKVRPNKGRTDPHHVSTRSIPDGGVSVRRRLQAAAWSKMTDVDLARELDEWIKEVSWSDDPEQCSQQIRDRMVRDEYIGERGPMYFAMLEELKRAQP